MNGRRRNMANGRDEHFLYKMQNQMSPADKKILFRGFGTFLQELTMILTGFLVAFLGVSLSWTAAESSDEEIPFVVASLGSPDDAKVSNLLPEINEPDLPPLTYVQSPASRGRSDVEVDEDQPLGGYFYPKPTKTFNLPAFKTLDANVPLEGVVPSTQENVEIKRLPRSPRRRPYFQSPPPFIPGFIPPNQIRPLPALYGRPQRY